MDILRDTFTWLNDPLNWTGRDGVIGLTLEHLAIAAIAVLIAAALALPVGILLGHRRRGGTVSVVLANTSRALPTLALLTLFAAAGMFGNRAIVIAAAIFAVPPILSNAYTGVLGVDPDVRDAARGMGMSGPRLLRLVELPLALPLVAAGLRTAAVQVVATVPLAALVGGGGLGVIIVKGFGTRDFGQVVAGGLLVAALCLAVEGVLAVAQWAATPPPMRRRAVSRQRPALAADPLPQGVADAA